MLKLCRRVGELLKKHPTLWLPYIIAELLSISLWRLRGLAERGIFHWFTTGHSALGGSIELPRRDLGALTRATEASLPVGIISVVAVVYFFVGALVATAVMVDSIEREHQINPRRILTDLAAAWRKILLFTVRFLLTLIVCAVGVIVPVYYFLWQTHRLGLYRSIWLEAGLLPLVAACAGWLVLPPALRLHRGEKALAVSSEQRIRGTILTVLATETGAAIGIVVPKLEHAVLLDAQWQITALSVFNSIVANAPDAALFVALGLLASGLSAESSDKSSALREILPTLMPLHFDKLEEPPEVDG